VTLIADVSLSNSALPSAEGGVNGSKGSSRQRHASGSAKKLVRAASEDFSRSGFSLTEGGTTEGGSCSRASISHVAVYAWVQDLRSVSYMALRCFSFVGHIKR
jgi:hypothetical protein